MLHSMVPANLKPGIMIKERDQYCYHVMLNYITIDPTDPTHPHTSRVVKSFRNVDYRKYFDCPQDRQTKFLKAMGVDSAEVVHDPTYKKEFKETFKIADPVPFKITDPIKIEEAKRAEGVKKEREFVEARKIHKPSKRAK